jgi:DNA-binding sugar fermentation-stimulating protein
MSQSLVFFCAQHTMVALVRSILWCAAATAASAAREKMPPKAKGRAAPLARPSRPSKRGKSVVLLDLGSLISGKVVKRPSAVLRSPYVADVTLSSGEQVLCHCPSLGTAGMVTPDAHVYLTKSKSETSKTSHVVQLTEELREAGTGDHGTTAIVGAHPALAEVIAKSLLEQKLVPQFGKCYKISSQKTYGNCRVDFVLSYDDGSQLLCEVKNVVGADYPRGQVPEGRSADGVYQTDTHGQPYSRTAVFPHGKRKATIGVVSDRAIKHIHHLTQLHVQENTIKSAIWFIVNRSDTESFRPCHEACPLFASVLKRAQESGVIVLAHSIEWDSSLGTARLCKALPVTYDASVSSTVDAEKLQAVLDYNAEDSSSSGNKVKRKNSALP